MVGKPNKYNVSSQQPQYIYVGLMLGQRRRRSPNIEPA